MLAPVNSPNVFDFLSYQQARQATVNAGRAQPISARSCRHCGASLMDGESDDDCSSLGVSDAARAPRRISAE
ncbi:hypothetical protein [Tardiphaga sp.]|uniref:hypothetical protein n=1 Tax=Tardiphaga sp. TaxID=1926292 RepID=UPI0026232D6E|nr:hypothetical protein [Tardiphaga sp.]MDB5617608.1 hypothetical protein [Tardiphaga sp.]